MYREKNAGMWGVHSYFQKSLPQRTMNFSIYGRRSSKKNNLSISRFDVIYIFKPTIRHYKTENTAYIDLTSI